MYILGIESSCDDTSISIVENGKKILTNIVFSQIKKHEKYFGVVPEIASREHLKIIDFVFNIALNESSISINDINAIAVTTYPGLIGSLIVGVNFAKGLSYALKKPLIAVNHLAAHIYSAFLDFNNLNSSSDKSKNKNLDNYLNKNLNNNLNKNLDNYLNKALNNKSTDIDNFPLIALLISGGHTAIIKMNSFLDYEIIGKTIDDAAGEAFDKVAKYFELGYPGGPIIDKIAQYGNKNAYNFPISLNNLKKYGLNFSFSGIKTAVMYHRDKYLNKEKENNKLKNIKHEKVKKNDSFFKKIKEKELYLKKINKLKENESIFDICASFQSTIAKTLNKKILKAFELNKNISTLVVAGGVSANSEIRKNFENIRLSLDDRHLKTLFPPLELCMDNGAMVAGIGYHYLKKGFIADLSLNPYSRIDILKRGFKI